MGKIDLRTINEFRKGNKEAFEEIFYAYKDTLYYIAYFYVKNYDDANDCVQEIFIRLVNKIHLYNERKAQFETWLFALAKSVILNYIRDKNIYYEKVTISDEIVINQMDKDFKELQEILIDLEKIMGHPMYVIYILRTGYKMSFESIAGMLNTSRETVRRLYIESIKIADDYMGEENNENKQEA